VSPKKCGFCIELTVVNFCHVCILNFAEILFVANGARLPIECFRVVIALVAASKEHTLNRLEGCDILAHM
jgi:hypothetical protein